MGFADLEKVFPLTDSGLLGSMFQHAEQHEKNWSSMTALATADSTGFWTIVTHHKKLATVIEGSVNAIVNSSAGTKRVPREKHRALAGVIARIVLELVVPMDTDKVPNAESFARRLGYLFPQQLLLPLALMFHKENAVVGAAVLNGLLLQSPVHLSRFRAISGTFHDNIQEVFHRCVSEAKKGRYQRKSNDILAIIESAYRQVKSLWALLHSSPFVANYLLLDKILAALRVVVDSIAPMAQYFVMSCDVLKPRRPQLTKATATLTSAAIDTAVIAVLYTTYWCGKEGRRAYLLPRVVARTDDTVSAYLEQSNSGFVSALLSKTKGSVNQAYGQLCAPVSEEERGRIGILLFNAFGDRSEKSHTSVDRFGESLLSELVHQGVTIDDLVARKFLLKDEAEQLGASPEAIAKIGLTPSSGESPRRSPSLSPRAQPVDPIVQLVLDVMPHFNPDGVAKALEYYNGDVEHLINDAMSANLPPHLAEKLEGTEPSPVATSTPPPPASTGDSSSTGGGYVLPGTSAAADSAQQRLTDDMTPHVEFGHDMHAFISSEFHDTTYDMMDATASTQEYGTGASASMSTDFMQFERESTDQLFAVDDDLRDKIKILADMIYEDERDDGEDGFDFGAQDAYADEDDHPRGGRHNRNGRNHGDAPVTRSPQPQPEAEGAAAKPSDAAGPAAANDEAAFWSDKPLKGGRGRGGPRPPAANAAPDRPLASYEKKKKDVKVKKGTPAGGGRGGGPSGGAKRGGGGGGGRPEQRRGKKGDKARSMMGGGD